MMKYSTGDSQSLDLLRLILEAVSQIYSINERANILPVRLWRAIRNLLWVRVLRRFGVCSIKSLDLGVYVDTLCADELPCLSNPSSLIPTLGVVTPNILQLGTLDTIIKYGGRDYVGKTIVRCA